MQVLGETLRAPMLDPRRLAARAALELGVAAGEGIVLLGAGKPAAAMAAGVLMRFAHIRRGVHRCAFRRRTLG